MATGYGGKRRNQNPSAATKHGATEDEHTGKPITYQTLKRNPPPIASDRSQNGGFSGETEGRAREKEKQDVGALEETETPWMMEEQY